MLAAVAGDSAVKVTLDPKEKQSYTLGRRADRDIQLTDPASRDHAMLICEYETNGPQWYLIDTNSKNGTHLNGVTLVPERRYPIQPGDLIQIVTWTFRVSDPDSHDVEATIIRMADDPASSGGTISEIESSSRVDLARQRLGLLMDCATIIHQAKDEQQLAKAAIEAVVVGTGFPNAAFLRSPKDDDSIDVVCAQGAILSDLANPRISRSLIRKAEAGKPCRMTRGSDHSSMYQSIQDYGIDEALCVPIVLAGMTMGFLYLDSRGESADEFKRTEDAADFAVSIAQLAAMAMANLMRLDLERRNAKIDAEIVLMSESQRLILPRREDVVGRFRYVGENRPGRGVSGDFFDVIPLDQHRVAVTLGDVVGKGMAASVLMTVAVGFLRAALRQYGDPAKAVSDLNEYLHPRCGEGRFITLWAAVLDAEKHELTYTDAGHGYAWHIGRDGTCTQLNEGSGMVIGVMSDSPYHNTRIDFQPGHRLLVVSDGIVEQVAATHRDGKDHQFGEEAACRAISALAAGHDDVEALFAALEQHAGVAQLDDDATAVVVQYVTA
jgi:phosphoserine phosphatase RsbU/P